MPVLTLTANLMSNQADLQPDNDEIDLRQLFVELWRQKGLIILIGLVGGALGLGASLLSTRYVSEGVLLTPNITATTYKRYLSVFTNGQRLQQFLKANKHDETAGGQLLFELAKDKDELAKLIQPEFAFTERDSKTFGIKPSAEDAGTLVGVHITFAHKSPSNGTPVTILSEFIRDEIIRTDMELFLPHECSKHSIRGQELRNTQLQASYTITEKEQRAEILRKLVERHPNSNNLDSRQIVTLDNDSSRFLSPIAQLIATEVNIADMQIEMNRLERERNMSALKLAYYCTAQQQFEKASSGRDFLASLQQIQQDILISHDQGQDFAEETRNQLRAEWEKWNNTYLQNIRFITPPEGNETKTRKPRLVIGLALGGILGGMFGIFIALVRAWWRGEQKNSANNY